MNYSKKSVELVSKLSDKTIKNENKYYYIFIESITTVWKFGLNLLPHRRNCANFTQQAGVHLPIFPTVLSLAKTR